MNEILVDYIDPEAGDVSGKGWMRGMWSDGDPSPRADRSSPPKIKLKLKIGRSVGQPGLVEHSNGLLRSTKMSSILARVECEWRAGATFRRRP